MVLTLDNAGALVPGVTVKEVSVEMQKVKILSSFSDGHQSLEKGSIVIIPKWMAVQAKDANLVEFIPEEKLPEEKVVKPETIKEVTPKIESKIEIKEDVREDSKKSKKG